MPNRDRPCGVRGQPKARVKDLGPHMVDLGVVRVMGREEQANLPNPVKRCLQHVI